MYAHPCKKQKANPPEAFFDALCALKEGLADRGLYDEMRRPFISFALDCCRFNLESFVVSDETSNAYERVYHLLRIKGLDALEISGQPESAFYGYSDDNYEWLQDLERSSSAMEFAMFRRYPPYDEIDSLKRELQEANERIGVLENELEEVYRSYTYRVGDALMKGPRILRQTVAKKRG